MAAKDIEAGRAHVLIALRDRVTAGLKRVQKNFTAWGKSFTAAGGALAGASAAVLSPLFAAANSFATAGDAIQKMALRTGVSAEALSELSYAAGASGTDIGTVEKALARAQKVIHEAGEGMKSQRKILKGLGLDYKQLGTLSPEEQFMSVAGAIGAIEDPTARAAQAMEIFGRSGTQLLPLLGDDIAKLRDEARRLGLTMSTDDANAAAALGDAMARVTASIQAAWIKVGAAIAPALIRASDLISAVTGAVANWVDANRPLFVGIAAIAAGVGALGGVLLTVGVGLLTMAGTLSAIVAIGGAIATAWAALGATLAAVFSPFGAAVAGVVVALVAVGVAAYYFRDSIASALASVVAFFQPLIDAVQRVWSVFAETFAGVVSLLGSGQLEAAANAAWLGFVAAAWQAMAELGNAIDAALNMLAYFVPGIDSLRQYAIAAFGSIGQSILAGRWDLAAGIAMTKIRLVVQSGLSNISFAWSALTVGLATIWDNVVFGIKATWRTAVTEIAKGFIWVAQQFGFSMEGVTAELDRMRAADQRADDKAKAGRDAARYAAAQATMDANKAKEDKLRQQIADLEGQSAAAFAEAGAPTIQDVATKARDELRAAVTLAQKEATKPADLPPGLKKQAGAAAEQLTTISSAGTFSAAGAAQALGVDTTPAKQTAANTKKMVQLMEQRTANAIFT